MRQTMVVLYCNFIIIMLFRIIFSLSASISLRHWFAHFENSTSMYILHDILDIGFNIFNLSVKFLFYGYVIDWKYNCGWKC